MTYQGEVAAKIRILLKQKSDRRWCVRKAGFFSILVTAPKARLEEGQWLTDGDREELKRLFDDEYVGPDWANLCLPPDWKNIISDLEGLKDK